MQSDRPKKTRIIKLHPADVARRNSSDSKSIILPALASLKRVSSGVPRYYSFIADETTLTKPLEIPPGLYSFIQSKSEKKVYLRLIVDYEGSAHHMLVNMIVKLPESDLLTAGEMVIEASGRLGLWAFRTGGYGSSLHLKDEEIMKGMIQKKVTKFDLCGLPRDKFYFAQIWFAYYKAGFTKCFFDDKGRFRLKSDYSQIIPSINQGVDGKFRGMHAIVENIAIELGAVVRPKPLEEKLNIDIELGEAYIAAPASTRNNSLAYSETQYSFFPRRGSISSSTLSEQMEFPVPTNNNPAPRKRGCFPICF